MRCTIKLLDEGMVKEVTASVTVTLPFSSRCVNCFHQQNKKKKRNLCLNLSDSETI